MKEKLNKRRKKTKKTGICTLQMKEDNSIKQLCEYFLEQANWVNNSKKNQNQKI